MKKANYKSSHLLDCINILIFDKKKNVQDNQHCTKSGWHRRINFGFLHAQNTNLLLSTSYSNTRLFNKMCKSYHSTENELKPIYGV